MLAAPTQHGRRARVVAGWTAWVSVLVVVALGGAALGPGTLALPALGDPASWAAWASGRAPLEAAFAVLAVVVVMMAWYLLVVTSLAVIARLWGARRLLSVVEVLTLPVVRHSLHAALGITVVGTTVAGGAAAVVADRPEPMVAIAAVPDAASGGAAPETETDPAAVQEGDEADPPVMRLLPEQDPPDLDTPSAAPTSPTSQATGGEWEVRPGDHLWSVAVRVVAEAGAAEGDAEVARYWLRLIEANAERLADPANPDLIFPGQVFALPVVSSPGERALP